MKKKFVGILKLMKRNKAFTKTLSFTLSLILIFYVIPSTIFAEAKEAFNSTDINENTEYADGAAVAKEKEPFEVLELREEYTKHFRLSDGSFIAAQYNYPVHTLGESGEWQDIDNALAKSGSEFSSSDARIKFAKKINGSSTLFTLHEGNTKITLNLIGANKGTKGAVTNGTDAEEDTVLQKMMNLEKLTSTVKYEDILDGVDLEYVAYSKNVKENIIVKEKKDSYSYSFELKLNGLTPRLTEAGDIELRLDGTDEIKYVIPSPVVFDSDGSYASDELSAYTLTHDSGKKYILTITVDSAWMNAEERAFPVTVDPAITSPGSGIVDTYTDSADPQLSGLNDTTLYITDTRMSYWKSTVLPTIPKSANITEAKIKITTSNIGISGGYIGVYGTVTNWDPGHTYEIYYNYGDGVISNNLLDYCITKNEQSEYSFNITTAVKQWYEGYGYNFGVAFSKINGYPVNVQFHSNKASVSTLRPTLTISYRDMKGIEPYWSYSSQSVGSAGIGNVNLAHGNLVFTIPTLTTTDSIFAYTPYLTYDSYLANEFYYDATANMGVTNTFLATGIKLNVNETLRVFSHNNGELYYVYSDPDGTEHSFYLNSQDNLYYDEDGLGLELRLMDNDGTQTDAYIYLVNAANEILCFEKVSHADFGSRWRLSYIEDINGNKLVYTYNNIYYSLFQPTKISLLPNGNTTPIDLLEFRYHETTGKLIMVYNPTAKTAAVFRYSSSYNSAIAPNGYKYLRQMDYAVGNESVTDAEWYSFALDEASATNITVYDSAKYNYDSEGRLTEVINTKSDISLKYTWYGNKVSKISEYSGETLGGELGIEYALNFAEIRATGNDEVLNTSDDILTRYTLDNFGRAVSVYSCSADGKEIFGATSGVYDTQAESVNSLTQKTVLGETQPNLLLDGDFKNGKFSEAWDCYGATSRDIGDGIYKPNNLFFNMTPTVQQPVSAEQTVSLKAGKYTFSMRYSTEACDGVNGRVEFVNDATDEMLHVEVLYINASENAEEQYFSTSFSVDTDCDVTVKIIFEAAYTLDSSATVKVGRVKLEMGDSLSDYTLINAGGFDTTLNPTYYWKENNGANITVNTEYLTGYSYLRLIANSSEKYAKQNLFTRTESELEYYENHIHLDDTEYMFTLSGYAMAENPLPSKEFRMYAEVVYYYGANEPTVTEIYPVEFNTISSVWQFATGTFSLRKKSTGEMLSTYICIKSVDIVCDYSGQLEGRAYFDNISLTFSGLQRTEKTEYNKGLPVKIISGDNTLFYVYNDRGNVEIMADNKGNITIYEYKDKNHPDRVTDTTEGTYIYNGSKRFYPYNLPNHNDVVTRTDKFKTEYTYNSYGLLTEVYSYVAENESIFAKQTYTYETGASSKIFGALLSEKNADSELVYIYNESDGLLLATANNLSHHGYAYTYDGAGRLLKVDKATVVSGSYSVPSNSEQVSYEYDEQNRLTGISTRSTEYTLSYDIFGNSESISVGDRELAEYEYFEHNGKLKKVIYGNGYEIEYVYDELERLKTVKQKTSDSDSYVIAYEYEYTTDGQVRSLTDKLQGRVILYRYDEKQRLESIEEYSTEAYDRLVKTDITYNSDSKVTGIVNTFGYVYYLDDQMYEVTDSIEKSFTYLDDGRLNTYTVQGNFSSAASYNYDSLDRISSIVYNNSSGTSFMQSYSFTYRDFANYGEGSLVETFTSQAGNNSVTYTYTYDSDGNITKISYSNGKEILYTYDSLGQLKTEDNDVTGYYYTYTYDKAGNLVGTVKTSQSSGGNNGEVDLTDISGGTEIQLVKPIVPLPAYISNTYTYSDVYGWGDLLTAFNGVSITYDEIGNPLSYYNGSSYTFTWQGRELIGTVKGSNTMSFSYNDIGLRISKTVNGITTHYLYDGDLLLSEYTDTQAIVYIYDANDSPIGFKYRSSSYSDDTWDVYWYEKNLQGDIVAIYNKSGTKLVTYSYNAWGVTTKSYSNNGSTSTAAKNNLTYRGYYYDSDLGLYYLQSRYYDANTCRFINADAALYHRILGYNMFSYCENNPVNHYDPTGENAVAVTKYVVSAAGLSFLDGPLPIVDILCFIVIAVLVIEFVEIGINKLEDNNSISSPDDAKTNDEPELDERGYPVVKPGQTPTDKDGYIAPKDGPVMGKSKDGRKGWKDKYGNIWIPAPTHSGSDHGGGHWDVQSPGGGYMNVYPGGSTRGGRVPYPKIGKRGIMYG